MQFSFLHFKHPNILHASDELTFMVESFSGVYHPQDVRDEKVSPGSLIRINMKT